MRMSLKSVGAVHQLRFDAFELFFAVSCEIYLRCKKERKFSSSRSFCGSKLGAEISFQKLPLAAF